MKFLGLALLLFLSYQGELFAYGDASSYTNESWLSVVARMRATNPPTYDDNTVTEYPRGDDKVADDFNRFAAMANPMLAMISAGTQGPTADCSHSDIPGQQDGGADSGYDDYPSPGTLSFIDEVDEQDTSGNNGESTTDDSSSAASSSERAPAQISDRMQKMLDAMKENVTKSCKESAFDCEGTKRAEDPIAYCWRYVKKGLLAGGYTEGYPPGLYASRAGDQLEKMGFTNAIDQYETSMKAPPGAILVYAKTNSDDGTPGHIEVVDEQGKLISDYTDDLPIDHPDSRIGLSATRKLIGIYIEGDS